MTRITINQYKLLLVLTLEIFELVSCRPQEKSNDNLKSNLTPIPISISPTSPESSILTSTESINQLSSTFLPTTLDSIQDQIAEDGDDGVTLSNTSTDPTVDVSSESPVSVLLTTTKPTLASTVSTESHEGSRIAVLSKPPVPVVLAVAESRTIHAGIPEPENKTADDEKWEFDGPIRRCNAVTSNTLNKCLRLIVQDLRPKLKTGIPELNLPPVDPLHLRTVSFQHGSGPIKVIATFKNVDATGLGNFNKTEFEVDMKRRILEFDLEIPTMQIIGEYELSGNLFFFPIGGKGNFWVHLDRITAKGQGKLNIVMMNNRKTVQMSKIDIDLDINNSKVHLTNLFNGDKVLGNVINNFLNENSRDIFDEIRPQIAKQVGDVVQLVSNRALAVLGADHFADVRNSKLDVI